LKQLSTALKIKEKLVLNEIIIHLPSLILYELGSILRKHPAKSFEDVKAHFEDLLNLGVIIHDFKDPDMLANAFQASKDLNITFYDACYIILAEKNKSAFITADQELYEKARRKVEVSLL
jgi:predicted nucleic acid-binding protein